MRYAVFSHNFFYLSIHLLLAHSLDCAITLVFFVCVYSFHASVHQFQWVFCFLITIFLSLPRSLSLSQFHQIRILYDLIRFTISFTRLLDACFLFLAFKSISFTDYLFKFLPLIEWDTRVTWAFLLVFISVVCEFACTFWIIEFSNWLKITLLLFAQFNWVHGVAFASIFCRVVLISQNFNI